MEVFIRLYYSFEDVNNNKANSKKKTEYMCVEHFLHVFNSLICTW